MPMEIWAAVFAVYLTGGAYFAHSYSRVMWGIVAGRNVPSWIRAELGRFALLALIYVLVWPACAAAYWLFLDLVRRRTEEIRELASFGMSEFIAEFGSAHPGPGVIPMPAPPPRAVPYGNEPPVEVPTHLLFLCPDDPRHHPVEDPGKPIDYENPVQTLPLYVHGSVNWVRSVRCACGSWVAVYEKGPAGVRSEHSCASPEHEPRERDRSYQA